MSNKEEKETSGTNFPLPVPKSMRTDRRSPRIIAVSVVVVWLVILYLGTTALARQQNAQRSPLDNLLEVGSHRWIISLDARPQSCVGLVASDFHTENAAKLNLSGQFLFSLSGKVMLTTTSGTAKFSNFRKLEFVDGTAKLPTGSITIKTSDDQKNIHLNVTGNNISKNFEVPQPDPVYLVERKTNHFSLMLPKDLQQLLDQLHNANSNFHDTLGLKFTAVNEESYNNCKNQIATNISDTKNTIDLSRLASLFRAGSAIQNLTKLQ